MIRRRDRPFGKLGNLHISTTSRKKTPMSQAVTEHRAQAPTSLNLAVLTVSDTRTVETDTSGALIVALAEGAGHVIRERTIVPDEPDRMRRVLEGFAARPDLHAILVTGGTGISARDQTYETVSALLSKPLPGFGELFRMLSFAEIGPACMLSRAVGGLIGRVAILVMPGSRAAVELAMTKIILPELPHLVREAHKH
jgi:molybdenum cofactor biosynthesis protein B